MKKLVLIFSIIICSFLCHIMASATEVCVTPASDFENGVITDYNKTKHSKSGLQYNGGISITSDTVINAIAIKDGLADSSIATFNYTVKQTNPSLLDYTVTYKKTSSYYKFYITFDEYVDNAKLCIALYDDTGRLLSLVSEPCEGDAYYIISVPLKTGSVECKTFVWADNIKPIAYSKSVELM